MIALTRALALLLFLAPGLALSQSAPGSTRMRLEQTVATTAAWTSATATDTTLTHTVTNLNSLALTLRTDANVAAGTLFFEASDDAGTNWYPLILLRQTTATGETGFKLVPSQTIMWMAGVAGTTTFRVRLAAPVSGTGTVNLRVQASAGAPEVGLVIGGAIVLSPTPVPVTVQGGSSLLPKCNPVRRTACQ